MLSDSQGYPSPSCCNSFPNNKHLLFLLLPLFLQLIYIFTTVGSRLAVQKCYLWYQPQEFIHKGWSRDVVVVQLGVSVLQHQKILLAPAAAPMAVSRIPISQASLSTLSLLSQQGWQLSVSRLGLSARAWPCLSCAVTSLSFLGCLSFLECPRFCVAAILQCLQGDASPKGSTLSWGCVLTFCASFGLWAAAVWGGCCPNSQPPWAVALWALFELFLQFLHWSLAGGQP